MSALPFPKFRHSLKAQSSNHDFTKEHTSTKLSTNSIDGQENHEREFQLLLSLIASATINFS
uniref:Uncharacterized protein n=1 Tax=Rhizophora mucronata TaxID=61149 RepID=A0A2P2PNE6_RHIMU